MRLSIDGLAFAFTAAAFGAATGAAAAKATAFALVFGLDFGFSFGEFVDFFLGWFGVDVAGDDTREGRAAKRLHHLPEIEPETGP